MEAACAFSVLCVLNAHLLEQLHDGQVAVIARIVQAIETVNVLLVDRFTHGALKDDLGNVYSG